MISPGAQGRRALSVEVLLAATVLASFVYMMLHLLREGYLPQPFFWVLSDPLMDWYNPAYWSHRGWGAYDVWRSVYPPLSFVFLRIFSVERCYTVDSFLGRDCDPLGRIVLICFFALNAFLVFWSFRRLNRSAAPMRTFALMLGLPMVWGFERGNLIIPTFTFFVLAHGEILRSVRLRWIAHALTINFKPYLILLLAPKLVRRRWRWLEGCAFATVFVYLFTFAIVGGGDPFEIAQHTRELALLKSEGNWQDIYYATSFTPLVKFLTSPFPVMYYIGSRWIEILLVVLPATMWTGAVGVVLCMIGGAARRGAVSGNRLAALMMSLVLTMSQPSGYAQIFLLFFVFQERWSGPCRIVAIFCAYLLCISYDHVIYTIIDEPTATWLGPRLVIPTYGIAVGQFIRPTLLLVIQYSLIIATLREQWMSAGLTGVDKNLPMATELARLSRAL